MLVPLLLLVDEDDDVCLTVLGLVEAPAAAGEVGGESTVISVGGDLLKDVVIAAWRPWRVDMIDVCVP